jgi:RNA polymerase sigma-70 factor, ECF subfamily
MLELASKVNDYSDAELVGQVRAGDAKAFSALVERHHRTCVNAATAILRDRSDAEDEVQKACCKAFEHLEQYRGEGLFLTWLLRIVTNQCFMLMRARRNVRFLYLDEVSDRETSSPRELQANVADPEQELVHGELCDVLQREIGRIPPLLKNVLLLRDVQELPMLDVAARLKITVPAAKSRLLRARTELRDRMLRHCGRPVSHADAETC